MKRLSSTALLLAILLAFGSCGDDPSGPRGIARGTFTATATNAITTSFAGDALFAVQNDPDDPGDVVVFNLTLQTENGQYMISVARTGERIGAGVYAVGENLDSEFVGAFFAGQGALEDRLFESTGGTITLTGSTAGEVAGTFIIIATETTTTATVTLTGSFRATCLSDPEFGFTCG